MAESDETNHCICQWGAFAFSGRDGRAYFGVGSSQHVVATSGVCYGEPFGTGDVVGLGFEQDRGSFSCTRNGNCLGQYQRNRRVACLLTLSRFSTLALPTRLCHLSEGWYERSRSQNQGQLWFETVRLRSKSTSSGPFRNAKLGKAFRIGWGF